MWYWILSALLILGVAIVYCCRLTNDSSTSLENFEPLVPQQQAMGNKGISKKKMNEPQVRQFADKELLSQSVGEEVLRLAKAKAPGEKFTLALSGGSLPKLLAQGFLEHAASVDFSNWHVFFADERHVPNDHPDSNFKACLDAFLSKVPIPKEQIYPGHPEVSVEESASMYQETLLSVVEPNSGGVPSFDLVMLGMGPDGHTCSLFPGHPLLKEDTLLVAPILDSPKPPPQRITLTYPVLAAARNVFFLAAGEGKADLLPLVTISNAELAKNFDVALPAARVRPANGALIWFVDAPAASKM